MELEEFRNAGLPMGGAKNGLLAGGSLRRLRPSSMGSLVVPWESEASMWRVRAGARCMERPPTERHSQRGIVVPGDGYCIVYQMLEPCFAPAARIGLLY